MGDDVTVGNVDIGGPGIVNLRCPVCGSNGSFHSVANYNDIRWTDPNHAGRSTQAGVRLCPNPSCRAYVFVVIRGGQLIKSFPPQLIDFNRDGLPPNIVASFEEALKAHSVGAYRASALMVRRVLEEICHDKGATGKDLKGRLSALGSVIIIPPELLEAAQELRVLGNDAAHIEARTYDSISETELLVAVDLAKEVLKAVYQYGSLLGRLRALKKP